MKQVITAVLILVCVSGMAQKGGNNRAAVKDSIGKIKEIRNPFDSNKTKQPARSAGSTKPAVTNNLSVGDDPFGKQEGKPKKATSNNAATGKAERQNGYANQEVSYANGGSEPETMATSQPAEAGGINRPPQQTNEPAKTKVPEDNSPTRITLASTSGNPNNDLILNLSDEQRGWYKTIQFSCRGGDAIRFVKAELLLENGSKKTVIVNDLVNEGESSAIFQTGLVNETRMAQGGSKKTSFKLEKVVSVTVTIRNEPGATSNTEGIQFDCILCK